MVARPLPSRTSTSPRSSHLSSLQLMSFSMAGLSLRLSAPRPVVPLSPVSTPTTWVAPTSLPMLIIACRRRPVQPWSLISPREKLIKIGAKVVSHGRYVDVPDGRGRGVATDVRQDPVADRPAAGTVHAGMSGAGSFCGKRRQERYASVCAIQRFGALDRRLRAPFASG
jgi:hypothetical protein